MKHQTGRLEVICGSMFSGKSEELIRRIRRAIIARQEVQVFKPSLDYRYGIEQITSHNGQNIDAMPVKRSDHMMREIHENTTVVAIDEIQFFEPGIVEIITLLIHNGIRVIVAGLDTDFRGEPFGCMPQLLAIADDAQKLQAICVICGEPACRTQRLVDGEPAYYEDPLILIGAQESYEARCRKHHVVRRRHTQITLF